MFSITDVNETECFFSQVESLVDSHERSYIMKDFNGHIQAVSVGCYKQYGISPSIANGQALMDGQIVIDKLIPDIRDIEENGFMTGISVNIDTSELIGLIDVE